MRVERVSSSSALKRHGALRPREVSSTSCAVRDQSICTPGRSTGWFISLPMIQILQPRLAAA
jgi:hypothetical protein